MALTWRGSTVTPMIQAMPPANGNTIVFAVVNTFRSRATVNILRIVAQYDTDEAPTGNTANRIMPIMRTRRCAAVDVLGGVEIAARPAWDTILGAPDPGVKVLFNPGAFGGPDTIITATNRGAPFWEQYTARDASQVEQRLSWDNFCVPTLATSKQLYLKVGEALVIEQVAALPTGGKAWIEVAWEEDTQDAGYQIAGTVSLSGSPVNGAKVLVLTDSDADMPNPEVDVLTTGAPGTFSKTVATGVKASVFVQHQAGVDKYTDEGKPFITGA